MARATLPFPLVERERLGQRVARAGIVAREPPHDRRLLERLAAEGQDIGGVHAGERLVGEPDGLLRATLVRVDEGERAAPEHLGVIAAAAGADTGKGSGNRLAGTWKVTVNRPAPLPPLPSLQVFTDTRSVIETANEWPATRTAAYGAWERIEGRLYASTTVFFRFNPQTGAYLGTQKINRTTRLARDGQTFAHVARVTVLDPAGNVITTFVALASGERMPVERIADEP